MNQLGVYQNTILLILRIRVAEKEIEMLKLRIKLLGKE